MPKTFYITTTLPYVNADPHIGFAFELVSADIIARWRRLSGDDVFFNTGTDEHGSKVWGKAQEEAKDTQVYVDAYAEKFRELKGPLGLLPDVHFIRTTDPTHKVATQEFWRRCKGNGDIYQKKYRLKYCVGCELEKMESELLNGRCAIHQNLDLEIREEENYFFRLRKYQDKLLTLYDANPDFVVPAFRLNEIRSLIREKGLEDFSISRLKAKMPWGVPVPDDDAHVMYVWFDALVNYISAIGWPASAKAPVGTAGAEGEFEKWWPVVQFAGKDQVRQQAVMWQAMLLSAGLPPSKQIVIHGFIQSGGQKMSKSLGNVVDPLALVTEYGTDALRWYLARHIHPFEDSDFTPEKFREAYNADLANGIGNLTSRIMKLSQEHVANVHTMRDFGSAYGYPRKYKSGLENYNIQETATVVSDLVSALDRRIQKTQPFKLVKENPEKGAATLRELVRELEAIAHLLTPILPDTSGKILNCIAKNRMPSEPLFPRT